MTWSYCGSQATSGLTRRADALRDRHGSSLNVTGVSARREPQGPVMDVLLPSLGLGLLGLMIMVLVFVRLRFF